MIFNNFLQKLLKCEKLRRWAVARIWYFEGAFIGKVVRGHVDQMQIESRQVVCTYVFPCFCAMLRSRPTFSHRQMQAESCQVVSTYVCPFLNPHSNLGLRFPIEIAKTQVKLDPRSMVFWGVSGPGREPLRRVQITLLLIQYTCYLILNSSHLRLNTWHLHTYILIIYWYTYILYT